jgi:hypothetical protein
LKRPSGSIPGGRFVHLQVSLGALGEHPQVVGW